MKYIRNIFMMVGLLVVFGIGMVFVKYDLSKMDTKALGLYMTMADVVLTTGNTADGMIRKTKLIVHKDETRDEALENALEILNEVAEADGLLVVKTSLMSAGGVDEKGIKQKYVRLNSYCNPTIAKVMLNYSMSYIGFMPCGVGIIEDDNGDIWFYTLDLGLMISGGHTLPPKLLEMAEGVANTMYTMIEKAAIGEND
jgi:uncharacterized protein (DUF302 family)